MTEYRIERMNLEGDWIVTSTWKDKDQAIKRYSAACHLHPEESIRLLGVDVLYMRVSREELQQ